MDNDSKIFEIVKQSLNHELRPYCGAEINDTTIENLKESIEKCSSYKINNVTIDEESNTLMIDFSIKNATFDYE